MNIETARAQAEPLFPGDWERYERMLAHTDANAISPDSLDAATVGGWAWWAKLLVDTVLAAPPEDRDRVAARQLQAICCGALRLARPYVGPIPVPGGFST